MNQDVLVLAALAALTALLVHLVQGRRSRILQPPHHTAVRSCHVACAGRFDTTSQTRIT
jgi:hypothetical protein